MKPSFSRIASVVALTVTSVILLASSAEAIPRITRRGKYLYDGNNRFYIKGVAYQEAAPIAESTAANDANGGFPEPDSFTDPLALPEACSRDVENLRDLGVNAIRVYSVNSSLNHDACMEVFSNAGIYVILELALPLNGSINRAEPSWDVGLLNLYTTTIDAFAKYDNLLAVGVANEVVTQSSNANTAPFIKAAARDVKAYLRSKNLDNVLVTYASTDGQSGLNNWRDRLAQFLTCGSDDVSIDLYGLNSYAWCGNSSFDASGYDTITEEFSNLPVAAYLSEYGCVQGLSNGERGWTEVAALLSAPMTDTFSGGVAFSYFPQDTGLNYGLVSVSGDTVTRGQDWNALRTQYADARPPATGPSGGEPAYPQCQGPSTNFPASTTLPPTPNAGLCSCLRDDAWSCLLIPATENRPEVIGTLVGAACGYLDQQGESCDPILANGETGVYGNFSFCTAAERLEWAMSTFHEVTDFNAQSCDFSGNATVQPQPSSPAEVTSSYSTCLSRYPIGVSVPESPDSSENSGSGSSSGGSSNSNGSGNNGGSSGAENAAAVFSPVMVATLSLPLLMVAITLVL